MILRLILGLTDTVTWEFLLLKRKIHVIWLLFMDFKMHIKKKLDKCIKYTKHFTNE